jgi:hypothetical protein
LYLHVQIIFHGVQFEGFLGVLEGSLLGSPQTRPAQGAGEALRALFIVHAVSSLFLFKRQSETMMKN